MLVYAALTVAGVIAAAVLIWMIRSLSVAGRSVYRTMSPSARNTESTRLAHLNSNLAATPAPWGWNSKRNTGNSSPVSPHARKPMTSDTTSVRNVLTGYDMQRSEKPDTSCWPYRDSFASSSFESGERSTEAQLEEKTKRGDRPSRPWGW